MSVFIDTAVIMYAAGRSHPLREPCRAIIDRITADRLDGVTSAEVIQEILHRFAGSERRALGVAMARHALDVFAPVLPVTHQVMDRMPALVEGYPGLAARDLVHLATCLEEGITTIVSPDRGFDDVPQVARVDPGDPAALGADEPGGRRG